MKMEKDVVVTKIVSNIKNNINSKMETYRLKPCLALVVMSNNSGVLSYEKSIIRLTKQFNIEVVVHSLELDLSTEKVIEVISK
ncbi:MAG: hypothetical protein ACRCTA_04020, partial [Bacilli bacterium]